jgi:hypothetical protein
MKIALLGSAPTSVKLAPFADPTWTIWGCSPGLYPICRRVDEWFEVHRWEPPVLGRIDQQVPWFTPEYVGWMHQLPVIWMAEKVAELPGSRPLPWRMLVDRYGAFFFTSSLAWMAAMAIERILLKRRSAEASAQDKQEDTIGFWGVDMAAGEEYGYQRAGCQYFTIIARSLGIRVVTPPQSDLLRPPGLYGIEENLHRRIKWAAKRQELEFHFKDSEATAINASKHAAYMRGALDTLTYMEQNWASDEDGASQMPAEDVLAGLRHTLKTEGDNQHAEVAEVPLRVIEGQGR